MYKKKERDVVKGELIQVSPADQGYLNKNVSCNLTFGVLRVNLHFLGKLSYSWHHTVHYSYSGQCWVSSHFCKLFISICEITVYNLMVMFNIWSGRIRFRTSTVTVQTCTKILPDSWLLLLLFWMRSDNNLVTTSGNPCTLQVWKLPRSFKRRRFIVNIMVP